ncbi:MAG: carboxypeptidase regulatory-like domain-containing protein [Planctomycetaceae bacterium]
MSLNSKRLLRTAAWMGCSSLGLAGLVSFVLTPPRAAEAQSLHPVQTAVATQAIAPVVAEAAVAFADAAKVSGSVTFSDDFKALAPLVAKGAATKDPAVCGANEDVPNEELVVNPENKGIANVFVFLPKAPTGFKAPKPEKELIFDQKNCKFLPHGLCIQVGQTVKVLSDDGVPHNTHTFPLRNAGFNQTVSPNDRKGVELKYTKAEKLPIEVKCDFHTWMKAYHLILDHPFMAVSDANGKFEIEGLPAGKHEFTVWHEKKGYLDKKLSVEVKAGESKSVDLKYGAKQFANFEGPQPKSTVVSLTK